MHPLLIPYTDPKQGLSSCCSHYLHHFKSSPLRKIYFITLLEIKVEIRKEGNEVKEVGYEYKPI